MMVKRLVEKHTWVKFMSSKKATKIDEIYTVDLKFCSKCQIVDEDFVDLCGLLGKHELYRIRVPRYVVHITFFHPND